MIVDASALLAIVFQEEGAAAYMRKLADSADDNLISPINFVEAAIRVDKIGDEAPKLFAELVRVGNVKVAEVSEAQTQLAREAYQRFGKGNHVAKLNLGDCFAYALSKARNEPLLFKGDDFRLTDVEAAI